MRQKLVAVTGHAVLFALTIYLAMSLVSVGLVDLFLWSGIAIGLWSALGTPREWKFSSILGALQPIVQAVVLLAIFISYANAHRDDPDRPRSEGGEFFIIIDLVKSFVVVLLTIGLARGALGLARRLRGKE